MRRRSLLAAPVFLAPAVLVLAAAAPAPPAGADDRLTVTDPRPAAVVAALVLAKARDCWDGDYDSRVDGYTNNDVAVSGDPATGRATLRFVKYRGHAPSKAGPVATFAELRIAPEGTGTRIDIRPLDGRWVGFAPELRAWLAGRRQCFAAMRPY